MPITGTHLASDVSTCNVCKASYHKSCLEGDELARAMDPKKFQCNPCSVLRNVEWGHNNLATNTCTIDNGFETMFLALKNNTKLLENFPVDEPHQVLKTCLAKIADNKCGEAHQIWYDHIKNVDDTIFTYPNTPYDMWGNAEDVTFHSLRQAQKWMRTGKCSYTDCKERLQYDRRQWFTIRPMDGSWKEQIDLQLAPKQRPCSKCKVGIVHWGKISLETNEKTWLLRFSGVGATDASQRDDYKNLDKTIQIPDENGQENTFKLQSVTMHWHNHFVSMQNYKDRMIFFDGMGERGASAYPRRFREALPSDTDTSGPKKAILSTIVYIRQYN